MSLQRFHHGQPGPPGPARQAPPGPRIDDFARAVARELGFGEEQLGRWSDGELAQMENRYHQGRRRPRRR